MLVSDFALTSFVGVLCFSLRVGLLVLFIVFGGSVGWFVCRLVSVSLTLTGFDCFFCWVLCLVAALFCYYVCLLECL